MTTTPRKRQPIDAIIAKRDEIDEMLAWFTELSDDHFNVHPDEVTWATPGHLNTTRNSSSGSPTWPSRKENTPNNGSIAATPRGPEAARGSRW